MKRRMRRAAGDQENSGGDFMNAGGARATVADLPRLVAGVRGSDSAARYASCMAIRKILSVEKNPPIDAVLKTGVASTLLQFLRPGVDTKLQFEASWALTNIASGTTYQTKEIVRMGGIQAFVSLLGSQSPQVREQAVWAIGNIAGDSPAHRDLVLRSGAPQRIIQLCNPKISSVECIRNCSWTLSNLCRGKPQPEFGFVRALVPHIAKLLKCKDADVLTDTLWALSYVTDDSTADNAKIQAVIEAGVVAPLVQFMDSSNSSIVTPALRTVGNIVTGSDPQTQVALRCCALGVLKKLFTHSKKAIRKETCWTVSNITAGSKAQIQEVIKSGVAPTLINTMRNGEFDVRKEACWAVSNAISGGTDEQIQYLLEQDILGPLADFFKSHDPKMVMVALETVQKILDYGQRNTAKFSGANRCADMLEECGGLDCLEDLQRHDNEEIYEKAVQIIKGFFESEDADDEDEQMAPGFDAQNGQFSFGAPDAANTEFDFTF